MSSITNTHADQRDDAPVRADTGAPLSGPSPTSVDVNRPAGVRTLYGAAAAVAVSVTLPWAEVFGLAGISLSGGAVLYMLAFAGAYLGIARRVRAGRVTRRLVIAGWVLNAVMVAVVFETFSALGGSDGAVTSGSGVYAAGIGTAAGITGLVRAQRARR